MKKLFSIIISVSMLLTSFTSVYCEDDIKVTLDGQEIEFDVPPQIIDDRTLVPMRAIFEALGASVDWDGDTQTITAVREGKIITMVIGSNECKIEVGVNSPVNGTAKITLDVPPQIIDNRTLVPIRAVSESFDCSVNWDGVARTVTIVSPQIEPPETDAPTEEPVKEFPIEYDDTNERKSHEMRDFKILSLDRNSEGKYVMKYTLRTFLEGRGSVGVTFNCLDSNGNVVDAFGKVFPTTDYTWTWQEDTVTISGDTVKIEYVLQKD